jgi:DNA polymerase-3 subunit alpha
MNYVPLYIKTENSLLSSLIKIDELIKFAKSYNYKALSIVDNNMFGVMEFYKKCLQNDIKPIIGLEVKLDNNLVLYAKNYNGYKNLLKISTIMSESKVDINILEKYSSDLICVIPFNYRFIYDELNKMFQNVFISYKNKEEYDLINKDISIYMNETLYLQKKDSNYLKYLIAIRDGKKIDEINILGDNHLLLPEEIKNYDFNSNNQKILDMCNLKIELHKDLLPIYECPNNLDAYSYLKELCQDGMRKRFGSSVGKVYIDRLKYELNIINKMGFCNYFLVVYDYVKYAKEHGILVGPGRGSAAGSLVSYLLNITTIDPIKYNLLFERFLNPERVTMPDIDIDFQYDRREEVINYCVNKYGSKKVAGIITFNTLGAKQAIRDIGRVMDINLDKIDALTKLIDSNLSLRENYNDSKLKRILNEDSELFNLYKVSLKFEGLKRHTSNHAAGIVMCNENLDEILPLYKKDGMFLTAYSMDYLEEQGLLKMDLLAIKNLTLIDTVLKEVNKKNKVISFDDIPFEDSEATNVFTSVNTLGIFQFESTGMMNFLRKFRPSNFQDIVAALALFRPGPMNNIDSYIKRKQNKEKIDYFDKSLEKVLKPTYGIIIYQEQIMQIASIMAGFSLGEADILRRAMSKKKEEILLKEKDKFINGSIKRGYSEELARKIYDLILKFAAYGFNKAHSVSYATISYRMAYLKAHYKEDFMKTLLNFELNSVNKTKEYIYECKKEGLNILKPDINKSDKYYLKEKDGIRYPLTGLKNLGSMIVNNILDERKNGDFKSIYDFIKRTNRKNINKKTLISLIDAGCFDSFDLNHRTMIDGIDLIINYGELIKDLDEEFVLLPELEIKEEYSKHELLKRELDVIGLYISDNPITEYKQKLNNKFNICDVSHWFDKNVNIIGTIDYVKEVETKKQDKMCFIKISDELASIDGVVFPQLYKTLNEIKRDKTVLISGKVEKRFDKYQIIVNNIKYLDLN